MPLTIKLKQIAPVKNEVTNEAKESTEKEEKVSDNHSSSIGSSTPESIRRKISPVKKREEVKPSP